MDAGFLMLIAYELLKLQLFLGAEPFDVGLVKGWAVHFRALGGTQLEICW